MSLKDIPVTSVAQGLSHCNGCGVCCRDPCLLKPKDVAPIAKHLGVERAVFVATQLDFIPLATQGFVYFAVRPKRRADGHCHFLTDDKRCGIHEVKPWGGADFECWTPEKTWVSRDMLAWWRPEDFEELWG